MSASRGFHDLLFEVSNESRYEILVLLREKAMRITDISGELDLTSPETRRHVSRLGEVDLIQRDVEGFYHLTPYGEMALLLFQEFIFLSDNREYFKTHSTSKVPTGFVKKIGELSSSVILGNAMDFLRYMENLFKESKEYVWMLVDQFPLNSLSTIVETIDRGVELRVIEPTERVLNPDLDAMTSEETQALNRTRQTPLVDLRAVDEVNIYLFLSDTRCLVAFPTSDGQFDYKGFTATDESSLQWCRELFQFYWDEVATDSLRTGYPVDRVQYHSPQIADGVSGKRIVVEGRNDPDVDAQAIQDAVDHFDEVILRGTFNLGTARIGLEGGATCVSIRRSVVIRGEGREDDIPTTNIYKRGWKFPFREFEYSFVVDHEGIDVTIENLHFLDFNGYCIANLEGNGVTIRNNRLTLETGLGRGQTFGQWGDQIIGIISGSKYRDRGGFPGGALIEGNYLDFATSYVQGGHISREGFNDPNFRPDLKNHESYIGTGIVLNRNLGKVIVRDNVIRNMNARGIVVQDNYETAELQIVGNTITSEVYGSYPYSSHMAGIGIFAQSAWAQPRSGTRVEISDNKIRCDKLNYCGIAVFGPSMYQEGAGKLGECIIRDNAIHLEDGSLGILLRKTDNTEVLDNEISGSVYYGFHFWGSSEREGIDLESNSNIIEKNNLKSLVIKSPDEYSDSNVDGRMFTGSPGKSVTAHVWLNSHSKKNRITIIPDETVIDEGENNEISYQEDTS